MNRNLPLSCCAAIVLCSSVQAQVIDPAIRRGPLSAVGSILTLEESTRPPSNNFEEVYLKGAGDQYQQPSPWSGSNGDIGDYSMTTLFPICWQDVEIDAMSTGNAYISTLEGIPELTTQWAAVTLSVTNTAVGEPGNGWLERRISGQYPNRTTPGADLATHYFEGGQGIDPSLLGKSYVSQLAEHLGLNDVQDTDSLDIAMGVIASGTGEASRLLFQTLGTFYFSLTPACALSMINKRFVKDSNGFNWVQPDPATIYVCNWDSNTQKWSIPREYLTPEQLDLVRGVDDIDAIDVSHENAHVVFSTQLHPDRSQLRVYEGSYGVVYDLKTKDPQSPLFSKVTESFGLREQTTGDEGDDVDAVCYFDPELGSFDNLLGIAVPGWTPHSLGLSVVLEADRRYLFQVTGRVQVVGGSSGPGPPGGQTPWTFQAVPVLKIYCSWDFDPWDVGSNGGTWTEVRSGTYVGMATELRASLPDHDFTAGKPIYFRAEVRDGTSGELLEQTWVSALDI